MKVVLIVGHPRADSLCNALADAYADGAARSGAEVHRLQLNALSFAPDVLVDSPEHQPLEPDLVHAREQLIWADHLVFVYPTWWGTMPALLKGLLDRLVMPGLAFRFYGPGATEWEGLWQGKSAQLITTMDTPPPIYRWLMHAPGIHAMRNATLGFCGVKPVHTLICGAVRTSDAARRAHWIERARRAGLALHSGVYSTPQRAGHRIAAWLRALRLQFYPMSWAAYSVGALAGAASAPDWPAYIRGLALIVLLEAATVFCNEIMDIDSDRANRNYGLFTGGSRVLVDNTIEPERLRLAAGWVVVAALMAAGFTIAATTAPVVTVLWIGLAFVLTLGYTLPPLKLSYRCLGEIDVAFTHSALVLVLGALIQGAAVNTALLWLLALPLAIAILPSIVLAGIPDRNADARVGKHTLAEVFGNAAALGIAATAIVLAAGLGLGFEIAGVGGGVFAGIGIAILPHAGICLGLCWRRYVQGAERPGRIDALLIAALSYMLWFVAIPGWHLA